MQQSNIQDRALWIEAKHTASLPRYPVDMSSFLVPARYTFDTAGVPHQPDSVDYHPTNIAQYALAHWNEYVATNNAFHRDVFLRQANWLVEHAVHIGENASGWPISFPVTNASATGSYMSALTQGLSISVLIRAHLLTQETVFLENARRAVCAFERDILDGGVCAPIGENGIFFEEAAVYPATHSLTGSIFALLGLYDYRALTDDARIEQLISCGLTTLHSLLEEFDSGFWTYTDLLHRRLASPSELALHITLLEVLATYSGSEHCSMRVSRWKSYQRRFGSRARYIIASRCASYGEVFWDRVRNALFPRPKGSPFLRASIAVNAFPVLGGIRTVLAGIAQVTADEWQLEYLTHKPGADTENFIIHQFANRRMGPWQFPYVWLYVFDGFWKFLSLIRQGANYRVILPQDGVFTAAFAGLAGRLAGVRVVCIDHGALTLIKSPHYRAERLHALAEKKWPIRLLGRLLYLCYWPSLSLLARIAARFVDQYLIPGVRGDGVEETCERLGVSPSRLTRFLSMIDIDRHILLDASSRASEREKYSIAADAIVVAIVCRLMPEKGLDIAVEAISQALMLLSPDLRARVQVFIAGDGVLRKQVEEDIHARGLNQSCTLWGDIAGDEVLSLLAISDVFLNTTTRGTCLPMSILEAMASGCAVIASSEPIANERLLAGGRGIAVQAGNVEQFSMALVQLIGDIQFRLQTGRSAREYIAAYHSPASFKRILQRATYWSALDKLLDK